MLVGAARVGEIFRVYEGASPHALGPLCHSIVDVWTLETPIRLRGQQSVWRVPTDVEGQLMHDGEFRSWYLRGIEQSPTDRTVRALQGG